MDGTTILIILIVVVIVIAMSSSSDDSGTSSGDEVGDRAHSANRFDDRDWDQDRGEMDSGGGE